MTIQGRVTERSLEAKFGLVFRSVALVNHAYHQVSNTLDARVEKIKGAKNRINGGQKSRLTYAVSDHKNYEFHICLKITKCMKIIIKSLIFHQNDEKFFKKTQKNKTKIVTIFAPKFLRQK